MMQLCADCPKGDGALQFLNLVLGKNTRTDSSDSGDEDDFEGEPLHTQWASTDRYTLVEVVVSREDFFKS